jgi:hypothetical protein
VVAVGIMEGVVVVVAEEVVVVVAEEVVVEAVEAEDLVHHLNQPIYQKSKFLLRQENPFTRILRDLSYRIC